MKPGPRGRSVTAQSISRPVNAAPRPSTPSSKQEPPWSAEQWAEQVPPVVASVGLSPTPAQLAALAGYMALLQRWNATYNLTALRSPQDMLSHHLADCLVVVEPLLAHLGLDWDQAQSVPSRFNLLDVGSGGGLPGVVLAILCPTVAVTCVDTVGKKAAFIRQVAAELKLPNLRAEHARVEQLKGHFDVVASRAFASLVDFTDWTRQLLRPDHGIWMAMKGKMPDDELAALPKTVSVQRHQALQVPGLYAERCLLWLIPQLEGGTQKG